MAYNQTTCNLVKMRKLTYQEMKDEEEVSDKKDAGAETSLEEEEADSDEQPRGSHQHGGELRRQ